MIEAKYSEYDLVFGYISVNLRIKEGWVFLGLEKDSMEDWGMKFGKPVEKDLSEPTALPWADVTNHTDITKTQWKSSKDSLINDGYVFLGYDVDYAGDACFVLGKPVEPEPELTHNIFSWVYSSPTLYSISSTPDPNPLKCPHCGAVLVTSTRGDWLTSSDVKRYAWHCPYCKAEVSS